MPRMDGVSDYFGEVKMFSTSDPVPGFLQVALCRDTVPLPLVLTSTRLCKYLRMVLGATNCRGYFPRSLQHVTAGLEHARHDALE